MRILHISDLHIPAPLAEVPFKDWLGKRIIGYLNYRFRRAECFRDAELKIGKLRELVQAEQIDVLIISGDYTTLGTEAELAYAHKVVAPLVHASPDFFTLPGNHDVYLDDNLREQRFERVFADWLAPEVARGLPAAWPVVKHMGPHLSVIGLNSVVPNPLPWVSGGRIEADQLARVAALLKALEAEGRFIFVVSHHGALRRDGEKDQKAHGLSDPDAVLRVLSQMQHGAWLHGHIHHCYHLPSANGRPSIFCSGSTTHAGREGFWLFEHQGGALSARRGFWRDGQYCIEAETTAQFGSSSK